MKFITTRADYDNLDRDGGGQACLFLEGDSGGEVFVICCISRVKLDFNSLGMLLLDLESLSSGGRSSLDDRLPGDVLCGYDAWIRFGECLSPVQDIAKNLIESGVWINPRLEVSFAGVSGEIVAVLSGYQKRLPKYGLQSGRTGE